MKKILLLTTLSVLVGNLKASDGAEGVTLAARIIRNMCFDKKLAAAITSVNDMIAEMQRKHVEYLRSRVVSDYYVGRDRYITTHHYYKGDGDVIDSINKYKKALENLNNTNLLLAAGDGALLGVLVSMIGKTFKLNDKMAGIGLVLSSALLTLAKNKQVGKVPYWSYPTLTREANYFGWGTNIGTFLCIAGAGAAGYLGTNFLVNALSGKISGINDALKGSN